MNIKFKQKLNQRIMDRNATNKLLQQAKISKSDEFYTQLSDMWFLMSLKLNYYINNHD